MLNSKDFVLLTRSRGSAVFSNQASLAATAVMRGVMLGNGRALAMNLMVVRTTRPFELHTPDGLTSNSPRCHMLQ